MSMTGRKAAFRLNTDTVTTSPSLQAVVLLAS